MTRIIRTLVIGAAALAVIPAGPQARAAVRGKALFIDASNRTKPGTLLLCTIRGDNRRLETLVKGNVIDARFSPDGTQIVYGLDGIIRIMDLKTRTSRDICPYTADFTYFNWCADNSIYWSDGADKREIFRIDINTKEKKSVHKGNKGRSTVSLDGTRAAWVLPPVCAFIGGKQFRMQGGCGGAVSPSGTYLSSNLTTSHRLIGIFTFTKDGPSEKPVKTVPGANNYGINGFHFGRSDDWVCYVVEHPKNASPTSFICYWRTNDHIQVSETGKHVIKDFFDETDVIPPGATLEKITVCSAGPTNMPLTRAMINVGVTRPLKVVGHYPTSEGPSTPQVRGGITWTVDDSKLVLTPTSFRGVAQAERVTVTAEYQGKRDSFEATVLPELTGNGFKAEFFSDATFTNRVLTRVDRYLDFRWGGRQSPDPAINGRKPWSVRWTGMLDVQVEGDYTFYFLQGEGNDRWITTEGGEKKSGYGVRVDGDLVIALTKSWNYPWSSPKPSKPIHLKKGLHTIEVTSVDTSAHPVVAQLLWSGPGIEKSLLGGGYIHSRATAEHN